MTTSNIDPYIWSIDQVVEALCFNTSWWSEGRPNSSLPDPTLFEQTLRAHEVNGSTLLTHIDENTLKTEFEITIIGKRAAVIWAIEKLRERSPKYLEHLARLALPFPSSLGHHNPPFFSFSQSIIPWAQSVAPSLGELGHNNTHFPYPQLAQGSRLIELSGQTLLPPAPTRLITQSTSDSDPKLQDTTIAEPSLKRQKLTHLASPNDNENTLSSLPGSSHGKSQKIPKRVAPQATEQVKCHLVKTEPVDSSYFPNSKYPVDKIFYGNKGFGQVLNDADDETYEGIVESEVDFALVHPPSRPPGISQYVHAQLRHYFLNASREQITRHQKPAIGIYPYKESTLASNQPRSMMVFQGSGEDIYVTKEDARRLDDQQPYDDNSNHEWDFLYHWTQEDSKEVPLLGNSESEDETSWLEEIEAEQREEEELKGSKRGPFSSQEISEITNRMEKEFIRLWCERKQPVRERTAWSVWRKGQSSRNRRHLITDAKRNVDRLNIRIHNLKQAIIDEVWYNEKDIQRQCQVFEQSIFQRKEELWKISTWQNPSPPKRPAFQRSTRPKKYVRHTSDEDGTSLDNDSVIDDFVDIEEIDLSQHQLDDFSPSEPFQDTPTTTKENIPDDQMSMEEDSVLGPEFEADDEMDIDKDKSDGEKTIDMVDPHIEIAGTPTREGQQSPVKPPTRKPALTLRTPLKRPRGSIIDLTLESSDSLSPSSQASARTPRVRLFHSRPIPLNLSQTPEQASRKEIDSWPWSELEQLEDRNRLILKILKNENSSFIHSLIEYLKATPRKETLRGIDIALRAMENDFNDILEPKPQIPPAILKLTKLYVCYHVCGHEHYLSESSKEMVTNILSNRALMKNRKNAFSRFVYTILVEDAHTFAQSHTYDITDTNSPSTPSSSVVQIKPEVKTAMTDEESDDTDLEKTPHRTRKKRIQKNMISAEIRAKAQERKHNYTMSQKEPILRYNGIANTRDDRISINKGDESEHAIYINPHIASRMTNHQVEGVNFLWRELVIGGRTEEQGALLSHTMGLGKTMQVITLLVTIAEAAASPNQSVSSQIPDRLQKSRTLVICPGGLVNNWEDELSLWVPETSQPLIGAVRRIIAPMKNPERISEISQWYKDGGVLIIGYSLLRNLVHNKGSKGRLPAVDDDDHTKVKEWLLEGPNIIVADEAHHLKNLTSGIAQIASQFKSFSRIALTGSPLANKLEEYYAMIDWISPGYLGPPVEFRAFYQEPINEGLYTDSTIGEYRRALKRLKVLGDEISPKVNRADYSVLKNNLKSKTEFLVTVPLTDTQTKLYKLIVNLAEEASINDQTPSTTGLGTTHWLGLINILKLLCNHPMALRTKLLQEKAERTKSAAVVTLSLKKAHIPPSTTPAEDANVDIENGGNADPLLSETQVSEVMTGAMITKIESLFEQISNLNSLHHSYKTRVLFKILDYSQEVGDKVLVFSHSIPTLDYLERQFKATNRAYSRIDGTTRTSLRTDHIKLFNTDESCFVFLISTRAGGQGFNVTGANRVIILDSHFNPIYDEQAVGRVYRLGQKKEVYVYRFIAGGSFECNLHNNGVFKTQLAYRVVDNKKVKRQASKARDYIFLPTETSREDLTEFYGKDPNVLDRIIQPQGNEKEDIGICSIKSYETFKVEVDEKFTKEELDEITADKQVVQLRFTKQDEYKRMIQQTNGGTPMIPLVSPSSNMAINIPAVNPFINQPIPGPTMCPSYVQQMNTASLSQVQGLPPSIAPEPRHLSLELEPRSQVQRLLSISEDGSSKINVRKTQSLSPPASQQSSVPQNPIAFHGPLTTKTVSLLNKLRDSVDSISNEEDVIQNGSTMKSPTHRKIDLPTADEIRLLLTPEGIRVRDLNTTYKEVLKSRKDEFVRLVKELAVYDEQTKLLRLKHSPKQSLREKHISILPIPLSSEKEPLSSPIRQTTVKRSPPLASTRTTASDERK